MNIHVQKLEAFQMSCLRRILGLRCLTSCLMYRWWARLSSAASAAKSVTDVLQYLDMYVAYKSLYQHMKHFAWLSKPVLVTDLTTGRNGNVRTVVLDKPGSISWKPTSGSQPMLLGTWPVIVNCVGRNDPLPVKWSSEWVSECCKTPPSVSLSQLFQNESNSRIYCMVTLGGLNLWSNGILTECWIRPTQYTLIHI